MEDLIETIEQMQAEARDGMKRASRDSDPYLYQYLVGKFHAFGKVAGILKKQKEPHYTKRNALFDKCVENCDPATMKRVSDEVDEMLEKEQKPAEWSEEDEEMLKLCENRIMGTGTFVPTRTGPHDMVSWLKSLRNRVGKEFLQPHWKPSEEQMRALLRVVDKSRELHYSSNSGYDEYDVLRLLYKQLKEL